MHRPFFFDDDDVDDLTPDATRALRHALSHARARATSRSRHHDERRLRSASTAATDTPDDNREDVILDAFTAFDRRVA